MADNEKITTSLEVDVTNFKKGLSDANRYIRLANSEFDKATAGVEKWSDSADGLRAKLTQLERTLAGQEAAADVLRHEYERVVQEQGETSKGAQELAIKLNKQEAACKKTAAQIDKYQGDLDDMEASTKDADKATGDLSGAMDGAAKAAGNLVRSMAGLAGKAVVTGIKGLAAASAGLVTAFLATGEASKEYISEMGKLEAAYAASDHSAQTATKTYKTLQGVIGETDQSVEAAQQIALLAKSEEDAAKWADQAAGVVGRFGDALQPEMFFESANETIKLGEATGGYTQMLEGCGYSVEKFNAGLQACNTAEEKQAYMLKITDQLLGDAADKYRENNAAIIESNQANEAWADTMAEVGETALPITSSLKLMGAAVLKDLLPNIKTLGTSFKEALGGSKTAAAEMGGAVSGILTQLGQKIVSALPTIITVGTSIISSLVQGIIDAAPTLAAGVGQIVQYFMGAAPKLLAAGGQMVAQLLSGIVNNLPAMMQGAMDAVSGFVQGLQNNLPIILAKGKEILGNLGQGIKESMPSLVSQGLDALMRFATTIYDNAPTIIDAGFDLLKNLVQGILNSLPVLLSKAPEIISKFANVINDNFPRILKKGVELIGEIIKGIVKAIPTLIANVPKIITAIVDVWQAFNWLALGKNAIKFLKDGVLKMVGAVKSAGTTVLNSITNIIKQLPGKLLSFGRNAITSLGNGIRSMISSATSAGTSVFNGIINIIRQLPSKLLTFGKNAITNLGNAIKNGASSVAARARGIVASITNTFTSLPSKMVSIGKDVINGLIDGIEAMVGKLYDSIKDALGGLVDKAKDALGIASPSKVMAAEVGRWIPAGIAQGIAANAKTANKAMAAMARDAVGAANAALSGSSINVPVTGGGATGGGGKAAGATYNFYQYNNSPKALSRADIYRQTKNQLRFATQS